MSTPEWRQAVIAYIRAEARPVDKFGHQPRLYALATELGRGMEYDDDVVFAAAWMHDLGVFTGHRPTDPGELTRWDHIPYTIAKTREFLPSWGFPQEKVESVTEAIRTHQPDGDTQTFEACLLHDADILEQLGAIGALRVLAKVGRDTRYQDFSSVISVLHDAVDRLPSKMRLSYSMSLAEPRLALLRALLAAIAHEAGGLLF